MYAIPQKRHAISGLQIPGFCESFEAAVVGLLGIRRKAATGKLLTGKVRTDAIAASSLLIARCVGATAICKILLFFALHGIIPSLKVTEKFYGFYTKTRKTQNFSGG